MHPFSIALFATSGDPEGIRHLDKSNGSGHGVIFNKELFHLLKQEPGFSQAEIYILVGNTAEEMIYIGEADPVGDRLAGVSAGRARPRIATEPFYAPPEEKATAVIFSRRQHQLIWQNALLCSPLLNRASNPVHETPREAGIAQNSPARCGLAY